LAACACGCDVRNPKVLPTREGLDIRRRCAAKPPDHQAILLQHLGLTLASQVKQTEM